MLTWYLYILQSHRLFTCKCNIFDSLSKQTYPTQTSKIDLKVLFVFIIGELPMEQSTLFEYFWDVEKNVWTPWIQLIPKYIHEPDRKFSEILVPTVDTVRTEWLLRGQVRIKRPVLLVGETGTSKTATTANFLRTLDKDTHVSLHSSDMFEL